MASQKVVTPLKKGVQRIRNELKTLDSRFHGNDGKGRFLTFYEFIKIDGLVKSSPSVTPAKAGVQKYPKDWIPACAGMTEKGIFCLFVDSSNVDGGLLC
jgi:hypothetical protein